MRSTGIYLTNGTVRAAELTGSARKPRLTRYQMAIVPSGEHPGDVLGEMIKSSGISTSRVCVGLGGEGAVVRRLILPVSNSRAAQKAVRFQAEDLLCGESLEDVVVDHEVIGPAGEGSTEVLVLIVKKRKIAEAISTLATAGISDVGVTVDGAALFNLVAVASALAPEGRTALMDFDGDTVKIIVAHSGRLEVYRTVRVPGDGTDAGRNEAAFTELERTLAGAEIHDPLAKILVTGKEGMPMAPALSERFMVPAEFFDVGDALGAVGLEGSAEAAVAAGAALKGLRAERLAADFRKEEFAPKGETRRIYYLTLYALGAFALLFAILLAGSVKRLSAASSAHEDILRSAKSYWIKAHPKKPFPRVGFDRHFTSLKKNPKGAGTNGPRYDSFLEALRKVSNASPGEGIQLQALSFDQQKVVLSGEVDGMDRFENLVQDLKARFGVRVKPHMERRRRGGGEMRTIFKIEIPRPKETR